MLDELSALLIEDDHFPLFCEQSKGSFVPG